jgi:CDP-glucose 4,6-dehydratase
MLTVNQLHSAFCGKRVFVTGHTGFKGAWLCAMLVQLGADVYGYSVDEPEDKRHIYYAAGIKEKIKNGKASFGDVGDLGAISAAITAAKPDFLFHLAAQPIVSTSYSKPYLTFTSNVTGLLNILEYLRTETPQLTSIIITSDKCYKNNEQLEPYVENSEMGGDDPYSASKAAAEIIFHSYSVSFPKMGETYGLATVRAGNVFGGGDWSHDRLIPDCARQALADGNIEIRMPDAIRPWTFVVDILFGYLQLAVQLRANPARLRGSWNFASRETRTVSQLVGGFLSEIGSGQMVINIGQSVGKEASLLLIDPTKAEMLLGWSPKFNISDAIRHTAAWYKLQSEGVDIRAHTSTFLEQWYLGGS